jgi:GT2 family glycosyltransferase
VGGSAGGRSAGGHSTRRGSAVPPPVELVAAADRASSYFARNAGAARGDAAWIVFLDADVDPRPDLLDAYFRTQPADDVAILVGAVEDADAPPGAPAAARYAALRQPMRQPQELDARWAYAQTANCAVRRAAFEQVGGFDPAVRSGGDADLSFRLRDAGWRLEARPDARVVHRNRSTVRALLRQKARHGAGAAWLDTRYPGAFPAESPRGMAAYTARKALATARAARAHDRDEALAEGLDLTTRWAFELGRRLPNRAR